MVAAAKDRTQVPQRSSRWMTGPVVSAAGTKRKESWMTTLAPTPDLAAIKQRQQATWASGDYHMIGTQIVLMSELLLEALDVHATERLASPQRQRTAVALVRFR